MGTKKSGRYLTPRECDALDLLLVGYTYKQVAHKLGVTPHTMNQMMQNARDRMEFQTTIQLAAQYALKRELWRNSS